MRNKQKMCWIDENFDKELEEIKKERIKIGKDMPSRTKSKARLTLGITRHPKWKEIMKALIEDPLEDKIGASTDLFMIMVIAFIAVISFGAYMYFSGLVNSAISTIPAIPQLHLNFTTIAQQTTGQVVIGMNSLIWISFSMFIAYIISMFVSSYYARGNPVFFGVNLLIVGVAFVAAVYISNAYENILTTSYLSSTYSQFTGMNFFMAFLPQIIIGVGIINFIFLFGAILKNQNQVAVG